MAESIYYYCNSKEVNTVTSIAVDELDKTDWSADLILSKILSDLKVENGALEQSIAFTLGDILAENVRAEDKIADDDFMCLKQFVKANIYMPDTLKSKNAEDVWELLKSHNLQLDKLSHEAQISLSKSLLINLNNSTFKPKVDSLIEVPNRVTKFEESTTSLELAFKKLTETRASKEEHVAPSILKKKVREIVNEKLMPYLEGAADALPEKYAESLKVISERIEETNIKARTRKTKNTKDEIEETVAE